jgi:hypothetical protein
MNKPAAIDRSINQLTGNRILTSAVDVVIYGQEPRFLVGDSTGPTSLHKIKLSECRKSGQKVLAEERKKKKEKASSFTSAL